MALQYYVLETKTKNMGVGNIFQSVEHNKKFSSYCPNLTLKHERTVQKWNSIKNIILHTSMQ